MYLASAGNSRQPLLSTSLWILRRSYPRELHIFLAAAWRFFRYCLVPCGDPSQMVRTSVEDDLRRFGPGLFIPWRKCLPILWGVYLFPIPPSLSLTFLFPFRLLSGTRRQARSVAIDVIVRRTTGYVLSTGAIVGVYSLVISLLNLVFRSAEAARSRSSRSGLPWRGLLVRPLHERIQAFVERVFYRQRYDYRKTIKSVSEAMTSILDRNRSSACWWVVVSEMFWRTHVGLGGPCGCLLQDRVYGRLGKKHARAPAMPRRRPF